MRLDGGSNTHGHILETRFLAYMTLKPGFKLLSKHVPMIVKGETYTRSQCIKSFKLSRLALSVTINRRYYIHVSCVVDGYEPGNEMTFMTGVYSNMVYFLEDGLGSFIRASL